MGRYSRTYSTGIYACVAQIDNICFYELTPCTNYDVVANEDASVSCNSGLDGIVSANILTPDTIFNYNNSYSWADASGAVVGSAATVSGIGAGTYSITVTDSVNGCSASNSVTVTEPAAISLSGLTVPTSTPSSNNGSVDLTVSGGTPCITAASLTTHNSTLSSNGSSGCHFNITNNSSGNVTITDFAQGSYSYSGANTITVYSMPAPYVPTTNTTTGTWVQVGQASVTIPTGGSFTSPVYSTPVVLSTPVVIPAGATYGFYVGGSTTVSYATATNAGPVGSSVASDAYISVSSGHGGTFGSGSFSPRAPVVQVGYGDPSASAYTFAWSTGDTTEDISGLGMGPVNVTATDCNGCSATWTDFVIATTIPGCMDSTAFNYNPQANVDDSSCIAIVLGCTDSTALNFNAAANTDDGSCGYPCLSGIGSNSESFEDPSVALFAQGPWANWEYDAASSTFSGTNGWRKDNQGTSSTGTGPVNGSPSLDGDYYLYCETSGQYNLTANLLSSCVDLNNFTDPAFVFGYHMLGATMGTLNVDVSVDNGANWTNEWSLSGDQGANWQEAAISLSAYAGQLVRVRMSYTSGTSFTGDCAIDYLRFMEAPLSGCTDSTACNYNPNAQVSDGSCYSLTVEASATDALCAGDINGTATAISNAGSVSYLWDNGLTTATISGLAPGTYFVTASDTFGCSASDSATVASPSTISASFTVGNESAAGNSDGQIDLTVSGGTPCATSVQIGSGTNSSYLHRLFYTFYHDGKTIMTYEASELAALGVNSGDIIDELAWNILSQDGSAATTPMTNANLTVNGVNVWSGTHQAVFRVLIILYLIHL